MKRYLVLLILTLIALSLYSDEYEELYLNGKVNELRSEIYSRAYFDNNELPRAAYYESLVTSKNFDQTLQELIEGFPDMEYKDQVNFKLGVINFFKRQYSQAEFYFSKIEDGKQINEYNYWLARLYFMKQDSKESSEYASRFIENCDKKDHKFELSYYMLLENSITEGNYQKAVVLAEELLLSKKEGLNESYLYYRIGYSYEQVDNLSQALENYKKSFVKEPYGQYASIIEERLFELKKNIDKDLDISFLYTKNYPDDAGKEKLTFKTSPKTFNITEMVRTDTSTVLSKFFSTNYQAQNDEQLSLPDARGTFSPKQEMNDSINNNELVSNNINTSDDVNSVSEIDESKNESNREIIQAEQLKNEQKDPLLKRPQNIQTEDYIFLMNKPQGKYFIQIGRFTKKEYAVNRVKEIFYLQKTWNIVRDVKGDDITYVIWSQAYNDANQAKQDISFFKSKQVDCFLVVNE